VGEEEGEEEESRSRSRSRRRGEERGRRGGGSEGGGGGGGEGSRVCVPYASTSMVLDAQRSTSDTKDAPSGIRGRRSRRESWIWGRGIRIEEGELVLTSLHRPQHLC
jgi:hypothetical protein